MAVTWSVTIQDAVIQDGVERDANYVGNLVRDLSDARYRSFAPIVSICMAPYMSLFLYESYRKLERTDPALATVLSNDVLAIVERSRHSLKLFEDTHRGVRGQVEYFRNEILPVHRRYFIDRWFPPLRRFLKDLGLYSYNGQVIATTHGATFHMGIGPQEQLAIDRGEMRAIYAQYGQCFQRMGARLDSSGQTFMSSLDSQRFNQRPDDVRAEQYYPAVLNGAKTPNLNAVLTVFRGMLNFVNSVIMPDTPASTVDYTVFKIRFLTVYEILCSLKVLRDEQPKALTGRSVALIGKMTGKPEAQRIMERAAKPFRNTLMHYNLNPQTDVSRVDLGQPFFGLVPIYFPSYDVTEFVEAVDQCIRETTAVMEEWAVG